MSDNENDLLIFFDKKQRSIVWGGEVTETLAVKFTSYFLQLQESSDPIKIVCTGSCGGDYDYAGLGLLDLISNSPNQVNYFGMGAQCSAAALMFCAGDTRVLGPYSYLLFHDGSLSVDDTTEGLKRIAKVTESMCKDTHIFLSGLSGVNKPPTYFTEKMKTDWYVFAPLALELGIATKIGGVT